MPTRAYAASALSFTQSPIEEVDRTCPSVTNYVAYCLSLSFVEAFITISRVIQWNSEPLSVLPTTERSRRMSAGDSWTLIQAGLRCLAMMTAYLALVALPIIARKMARWLSRNEKDQTDGCRHSS